MTKPSLLMAIAALALSACSESDAPDTCQNHPLFHAEHADSNAILNVTMSDDGRVDSEIQLPLPNFGADSTATILMDASKVYALQTDTKCSTTDVDVRRTEALTIGAYTSNCGAANKLSQVSVLLFESLPELNEVEVTINTPATQKHFVINRQCENAIFRIE